MNRFYRKYILHKYSKQISAYAKRPVFILSENDEAALEKMVKLNKKEENNIKPLENPFLKHIGRLAYEHFLGKNSTQYKTTSQLKEERLAEHLRKLSIKNTLGNNYGFDLSAKNKPGANRLQKDMTNYRWGAIINVDTEELEGLQFLFPELEIIE